MKRLLAIVCVLVCLSMLCVPAMAASNITVYVDAPDDWSEVYLYYWYDDQSSPVTWPGTAMNNDGDGWYSLEIPSDVTNIIATASESGPQTVDLKKEASRDVWLTVGEAGSDGKLSGVVAYDPLGTDLGSNTPAAPETLNSLAIVGENIPGLQTWVVDDAAGDMELVEENVYTKEITVTAGTSMQFKVAGNDTWDSAHNYGSAAIVLGQVAEMESGNESQNMTLTVDKDCTLKITVDVSAVADGGKATILVEEAVAAEPEVTEPETEATEPETEPETEATEPETEATEPVEDTTDDGEKKSGVGIYFIIALVVILCLALLLSIPKKIK